MKSLLPIIIIFSALLLAACNRQPSSNLYNSDDAVSLQQDTAGIGGGGETSLQNQATKSSPLQTPQKGTMKTLQDFEKIEAKTVTLTTTKGDITIELYREETPVTTANFLDLIKKGFYDGQVFHRVIGGFMAQVGDPQTKDESLKALWGTGGPGYTIPDEFNDTLKHDSEGILSMANTGRPNSGGSQIFITFGPTPHLDGKHTVFGKVTNGLEVLRKIEQGDKIISTRYQ
jgi:cyclophilin family peptidyl-prolyl cis-trans isomerase